MTADAIPGPAFIRPALEKTSTEPIRDYLILSPVSRRHLAIPKGRWMYIPAQNEGGFSGTQLGQHTFAGAAALSFTGQINSDVLDGKIRDDAPEAQLYDLEADPGEEVNVYREHPDIVAGLRRTLDEALGR